MLLLLSINLFMNNCTTKNQKGDNKHNKEVKMLGDGIYSIDFCVNYEDDSVFVYSSEMNLLFKSEATTNWSTGSAASFSVPKENKLYFVKCNNSKLYEVKIDTMNNRNALIIKDSTNNLNISYMKYFWGFD